MQCPTPIFGRAKKLGMACLLMGTVFGCWLIITKGVSLAARKNDGNPVFSGTRQPTKQTVVTLPNRYKYKIRNATKFGIKAALNSTWIFYNRMTKTGSRTFVDTFLKTAKLHLSSMRQYLPEQVYNESFLVQEVSKQKLPFIVTGRHLHVNYRKYGLRQPIGISHIRDPIERFVSQCYYVRYGDKMTPTNFKNASLEVFNRTIEECVNLALMKNSVSPMPFIRRYCGAEIDQEIVRFCGYSRRCRMDPDFALQEAKRNLNDYLVVGTTEHLEEYFEVLEKLMPDLLEGMVKCYHSEKKVIESSKTLSKRRPSDDFLATLRAIGYREYEFYDFVRERFRQVQIELGNPYVKD